MTTRKRRFAIDSAALAVGTLASGVLAYVFFVLASRSLGADRAAPVATLWTYWSISVAVFNFPLQHWIIHALAAGDEAVVAHALPRVVGVVTAASAASSALAWWGRESLFGRGDLLFPLMVGLITLGSSVIGIARGGLAGRERFVATAWLLGSENVFRVAGAAVAAAVGAGEAWFGWAMVAGGLVPVLAPSSLRFSAGERREGHTSPFAFLGGFAGGSLVAQVVLTGGPLALAAIGGAPPEVTALFATLALFRAPYILALGLVTQLTGVFTRFVTDGRAREMTQVLRATVAGTALVAVVAGVGGATIGPEVVKLVFGDDVVLRAGPVARVGVGTAFGLGNLVLTLVLVARGAGKPVAQAWLAAVAVAVAAAVARQGSELAMVVDGFVVAEVTAFTVMLVLELSHFRRWVAAAEVPHLGDVVPEPT